MTENRSDVKLAVAMRLENHELAPLAFLYESYEPQYWWWEILVCLQRLLMTNAQIYVASQPLLRPFVVLIFALVSVKLYSLLDPFILDSDDLFAEIKEWSLVTIVIFGIIKQVYEESNTKIQAGSSTMLNAAFLVVFGVLAYFCLKTISTEVSFFQGMLARLFPRTMEVMKKWGTETTDPADDEVTSVVEDHPGSDQESARCEEAAGDAASEMVPIKSEF